jgi:hypothetical protein
MRRAFLMVLAGCMLAACSGKARVESDDDGSGGVTNAASSGATGAGGGLASGNHVMAVSLVLDPAKPVVFDVVVDVQGERLTLTLQPLAAADRTTPVGASVNGGPYALLPEGVYIATLDGMTVPGEANPISGNDVVADVALIAQEPTCGEVRGELLSPFMFDLQGSTFTIVPASVANAHTDPLINCQGTHAEPL